MPWAALRTRPHPFLSQPERLEVLPNVWLQSSGGQQDTEEGLGTSPSPLPGETRSCVLGWGCGTRRGGAPFTGPRAFPHWEREAVRPHGLWMPYSDPCDATAAHHTDTCNLPPTWSCHKPRGRVLGANPCKWPPHRQPGGDEQTHQFLILGLGTPRGFCSPQRTPLPTGGGRLIHTPFNGFLPCLPSHVSWNHLPNKPFVPQPWAGFCGAQPKTRREVVGGQREGTRRQNPPAMVNCMCPLG